MDNLFDNVLKLLSSIIMERRLVKISNYKFLISKLTIFFFFLIPFIAQGYPIENMSEFSNLGTDRANELGFSLNEFARNLFGSKLVLPQVQGLNFNDFIPGSNVFSFNDLVNIKSFSANDISGSIKTIAILFIKLVILSLSIILAIFKMLLSLVVSNF